jgi:hypothetical protein
MANKDGHRRFGSIRKLPSGRLQIRYPGPDGRMRTGPETYERTSDAAKALVLIEAQMSTGEWTDPERGKVKLADYAAIWITERPKLRPRTVDLYRWLLKKHIAPYLGGVPLGKVSTAMIRQWRARLLGKRRIRVDGGQGIPATAGSAHDGRGGRQDPAPEPVPHSRCW